MTRRDPRVFAILVTVVCLLGGGTAVWIDRAAAPVQEVVADDPRFDAAVGSVGEALVGITVPPAPTTTAAPAPTPTTAAPAPKAPHADPKGRPAEPVVQIGTMEIPKIGLRHAVYEGNTLTQIDHGPSHWPGTAAPGNAGNAVFAGHRVTHSRPFRHIDKLVPGDQVFFEIHGVRTTYEVTRHEVVTPKDVWIINQTPTPTATLFACHPPGSARYRYVVRLALVA